MTPRSWSAAGGALAAAVLLLSGCTGARPATERSAAPPAPAVPPDPALRLVSYSSCAEALGKLRAAAKEHVGPYGLFGPVPEVARAAGDAAAAAEPGAPAYSGTNTHEAGVDEPDIVKTDGRRIVTLAAGVLRVVDIASRREVGSLRLLDDQDPAGWHGGTLLLRGDRALVLVDPGRYGHRGRADVADVPAPTDGAGPAGADPYGPRVLLVDVSGAPRVVSTYRTDGVLTDARQVGGVVRVVLRSTPRIAFPAVQGDDERRVAANRDAIDRAGVEDWLPRYVVSGDSSTSSGHVPCDRISYPAGYSGLSMLTVLTFDITADGLGTGDPITLVADGDTVYSNGPSLYVAADQRWRQVPGRGRPATDESTRIYKFDAGGPGRPRYVAGGTVPGWLLNQYSLSEWDGRLRVVTTREARRTSESVVHVLEQRGSALARVGHVGGLGRTERVYAVRFVGDVGYVVTFRQVDPLYAIDLSDPGRPRAAGELKITGYSGYLHPAGDGRLIGVGQEADSRGRALGLQVSLFDVSDVDRPARLARHHVRNGYSEVEHDPHAFLYWPAERLLVVPLTVLRDTGKGAPRALVLRVGDDGLTEVGRLTHPADAATGEDGAIRRSLVVGDVLWTVSNAGIGAASVSTLDTLAWIPT